MLARALLASGLAAAAAAFAGCGSSPSNEAQPSTGASHTSSSSSYTAADEATFGRIGSELQSFDKLETLIGDDANGTSGHIHKPQDFVRIDGPRVRRINAVVQRMRLNLGRVNDLKAAELYTPLIVATDHLASDATLFLNSIKARSNRDIRSAYSKLQRDEQQMDDVVTRQYPKVKAYAKTLQG